MKHIITLMLSLLALSASAWEIEASIGTVEYKANSKDGGDWRQPGPLSQGFRDEFSLRTNMWSLGATGDLAPSWKWRAGYTNLGRTSSAATATRGDARFDFNTNRCIDLCDTLTTFMGTSDVHGLHLTAQKHFHMFGGSVFVEAGGWYYRNKLQMWTYAPFVGAADPGNGGIYEMPVSNTYRIGKVLGFGYMRKDTSLAFTLYEVGHNNDIVPSFNDGGPAAVVSLRHAF